LPIGCNGHFQNWQSFLPTASATRRHLGSRYIPGAQLRGYRRDHLNIKQGKTRSQVLDQIEQATFGGIAQAMKHDCPQTTAGADSVNVPTSCPGANTKAMGPCR
jgi:hypothetical protein